MDSSFLHREHWKHKRDMILRRDSYTCQLCKRYGKTRNLIGYFTLENGQTIMTSAWQNDNYHGLQEVPFGAVMELEFVKNKRGVIHLRRATVLG